MTRNFWQLFFINFRFHFNFKFAQNWSFISTYLIFIFSWTVSALIALGTTVITSATFDCRTFYVRFHARDGLCYLPLIVWRKSVSSSSWKSVFSGHFFRSHLGPVHFLFVVQICCNRIWFIFFNNFPPLLRRICQLDKLLSIFHKFNTFCDAWLGWLDVFFVDSGRIKICFFQLV